jgi:hypothetical protein
MLNKTYVRYSQFFRRAGRQANLMRYGSARLGRMSIRIFLLSVLGRKLTALVYRVLMNGYVTCGRGFSYACQQYINFCAISETSTCFKIGGRTEIGKGEINIFLFQFWLPLQHGASMKLVVSLQFLI